MEMDYKDYGEINAADEDLIKTRILRDDKPIVAFRVKTGDENKCEILDQEPLVAEITVKKNEEYSDEVELPVLSTLDGNALHLRFRLKDHDGGWKCGYYWVYDTNKDMSENTFLTMNYEPWKLKVREKLREKAILLHKYDDDRQQEKSFVVEPALENMHEFPSMDGNRRFCVATSGNLFNRLFIKEELLRKVVKLYPENFGTNDPEDVLMALCKQVPNSILDNNRYRKYLEHEQYAWIVEFDENGVVGDKYLRLDLFRHVIDNEKGKDFQGGILHVLKHFCYCECDENGSHYYPLSFETNNDNISGTHYILRTIIEAFFMSQLEKEKSGSKIQYTARVPHKNHDLIAVFYYNEKAGVHFVNSLHIKE